MSMIKIRFSFNDAEMPAGESVWAEQLSPTTAKICNIPFFMDEVSLEDVVSFKNTDGINEYDSLVKKATKKLFIQYETGDNQEETKANYKKVVEHFRKAKYEFKLEGAMPGLMGVAYETDLNEDIINETIANCPHLLPFEE